MRFNVFQDMIIRKSYQALLGTALIAGCAAPGLAWECKIVDSHGETIVSETEAINVRKDRVGPDVDRWEEHFEEAQRREQAIALKGHKPLVPNSKIKSSVFEDGFFIVSGRDGIGVYAESGREILPPKYPDVRYVGEKMFMVRKIKDGGLTWYLADGTGTIVSELPKWARSGYKFHDGFLKIGDTNAAGFVDKKGKLLFDSVKYESVEDFNEGLAPVIFRDGNKAWAAYIDRTGKIAIGPFEHATATQIFHGVGIIRYYSDNGESDRYGVVDTSGEWILPAVYDRVELKANGDWLVAKDHIPLLLAHDGQQKIAFPNNCTVVELPDALETNTLIPCGFGGTRNPNARFGVQNSLWGYCDVDGKIVIEPKFQYCSQFIGDLTTANVGPGEAGSKTGVINRKGEWVLPPRYNSVEILRSDRFIVTDDTTKVEETLYTARSRPEYFFQFRQEVHFIGMSRDEVQKSLGIPFSFENSMTDKGCKIADYNLSPGARCGNVCQTLEILYNQGNKVAAWRIICPAETGQVSWNH